MMCLSQTAGYAIHALSILAQRGGRLCLIREIARLSGIPKPYLAKIFNQLAREGLVAAKRGYRGGIYLARPPREITLLEVVQAIEGQEFIAECMLGLTDCSGPCLCPTHDVWSRLREEVREALRQTTLAHVLDATGAQANGAESASSAEAEPLRREFKKRRRLNKPSVRRKIHKNSAQASGGARRRRQPHKPDNSKIYEYYD